MASIVDICNGSLNQLGATTIVSLTEDSKNARLCNARFTQIRDSVFRSHPWNCLQNKIRTRIIYYILPHGDIVLNMTYPVIA